MFTALWVLNLAVLVGLTIMAWSPKYGAFRGSAVNPLIIFVVFSLFFNINFAVLYGRGTINIFERAVPVTSVDILLGYVHYTVIFLAVAAGLIAAQLTAPPYRETVARGEDVARGRTLSAIFFAVIILIGLVGTFITLKSLADILSGKLNRQLFFESNPLLHVAYTLICPGLVIYLAFRLPTRPASILATLSAILILATTGSRGVIILVGLIYAISLVLWGRRIPAQLYLLVIPVLSYLLALSRYLLRESWKFRSFADFVEFRGGFGALFFNSAEVAMAEAITVISANMDLLSRPPFESFLGILMYPLPRSVFTFKPLGASSFLTATLSPNQWQWTKAEILTTGYGDFIMQFGLWWAIPLVALCAFAWLRGCLLVINAPQWQTAVLLPFLIWWMYIFMRGSIFNVGASIWPFLIVLGTYTIVTRISFRTQRHRDVGDFSGKPQHR